MSSNSSQPKTPANPVKKNLVDQWGGKLALFFTYTHISHDLITGLLAALLTFIRDDLNLNYLQAGFIVSAFALTSGVSQLLGGWLSDRLGSRKSLALGLGGVGLSAVALSFTHSYYSMLPILVIMGVFAGFYHPSAVSTLTNIEPERRGRAVALHMVGGSLGFGIGPLLGALIASRLNWQYAYLFLAVPALTAVPMVLYVLKIPGSSIQAAKTAAAGTAPGKKSAEVWKVFRSTIGIIAISVAMQLVTGPVMSFIPLFLVDIHSLPAAAGSLWLTVIRFGSLLGSLLGGWLNDKWGRRRTIFTTLAAFGPVVLAIALLPFGLPLWIAFVMFGWLMAMRETSMQTIMMDASPPRYRATVFGIYFGLGQEGSSVIQPIAGNFMDMAGIQMVYNVIAGISIALSLWTIFIFRSSFKRLNSIKKMV